MTGHCRFSTALTDLTSKPNNSQNNRGDNKNIFLKSLTFKLFCARGLGMACSVGVLGIKDCCGMMIKKICSKLKSELHHYPIVFDKIPQRGFDSQDIFGDDC
jgi:hypothetical protein